jgi:hypothetical protein
VGIGSKFHHRADFANDIPISTHATTASSAKDTEDTKVNDPQITQISVWVPIEQSGDKTRLLRSQAEVMPDDFAWINF